MAGSVNKVILVGNLGAEPDIRRTQRTDQLVVSFRLTTSETWRDKESGERKEKTEWHTVVVFNEQIAKVAEQYLKKGMKVYVEGQQQTRKWTGNDGIERYTTETVLNRFRGELQILDKLPSNRPPESDSPESYGTTRDADQRRQVEERTRNQQTRFGGGGGTFGSRELDDEIPFAPEWRG
ncbi:single-stranded DNA-binding protein [Mesorhizobium sp. 1M-11]|uniref:single-stranded DNA-binding protein n=1 Tax=Mesorhizobium sp. 1M-11 TaxID=1529006 RepID=UPI0006C75E7F|nr:single-stranded DNA-binding protein [Mesorhizobium sp. 1M-11]